MWWQRSYEGEVFVDHRFSPGLPEHVARLAGYDPKQASEGKLFEAATLSCSHCLARVIKNPLRTRERATCLKCRNHYICDLCAIEAQKPDYVHKPFEAKIEDALKWQRESSLVVLLPTQAPQPSVLLQLPATD